MLFRSGWFEPGPHTVLIDPESGTILPSDQEGTGLIARDGPVGSGYHGDPAKTAATYLMIDGRRYAVPGDIAAREKDGRIRLIGRGSQVINSGGEKIFTEEVEEALKRSTGVKDAIVVGMPDPKWGKAVVALVQVDGDYDEQVVRSEMLKDLASYKVPKLLLTIDVIPRHASGKSDYKSALKFAETAAVT